MKLCNIFTKNGIHLAIERDGGLYDLTAVGFPCSMKELIAGGLGLLRDFGERGESVNVEGLAFANVVENPAKVLGVGLNYRDHADSVSETVPRQPLLFSKFADCLTPSGAEVELPEWETSYDYEGELVIVIGRDTWNVSLDKAGEHIFGYTVGNDLSCRDAQLRSGQFLIGKAMPGFGPCGPYIVTADEYRPEMGKTIRSYVNGELKQDSSTANMIFNCREIVSYASRYIHLYPGDLIFTGTPSGVALEKEEKPWLKNGDTVAVEIEGIGTLVNTMK